MKYHSASFYDSYSRYADLITYNYVRLYLSSMVFSELVDYRI